MPQTGKKALSLYQEGYKCAESTLMAIAEKQGIESELIPRIATGLCSGMARTGGMCGAVAGSVMGLGLVYGREFSDDPVTQLYQVEKIFLQEFTNRFGSTACGALVQCDFNTEKGQAYYKENKLYEKCYQYVEQAADLAVKLIEENPPEE
jgi:C_GCAxxG_C_C family probable redox protein